MAGQASLESSLRRSASLGLEVLERASRRSVNWSRAAASQTSTTTDEETQIPVKRDHSELNDAFATMTEFMKQTTYHCKRFYESGCCTEPTDIERNHVSRFHTQPAARKTRTALPTRTHGHVSAAIEDFYIEVSPGTYVITASSQESQQHTQLVSVKAGESIKLTFNL
ncbi:A-kinase-interacting protein 1 [Echeneis naucrates]|uniref:A kinase (PRKA) interacting protein 1 n=1 Tax=Echeneis naucrates TaxID=173247 RepID=A0A665WPW5_ECHNA|nr:A-kinase-interacting protein 1 [Echeneis naucrates]XP_029379328.1 A-kinase-interacting protein 1 [Echeneis naucrates]XP_029379329.1 A-kinase-interacting protein 1 [Echeneis naucrates]